MLQNIEDFKLIKDSKEAFTLTQISYGVLSKCCRDTSIFGKLIYGLDYETLDDIRNCWKLFAYSTLSNGYQTWVDCWNAFVRHSSTLRDQFIQDFLALNIQYTTSSTESEITINEIIIKISDDGVISTGGEKITHVSIVYLKGIENWLEENMEKLVDYNQLSMNERIKKAGIDTSYTTEDNMKKAYLSYGSKTIKRPGVFQVSETVNMEFDIKI